MKALTVLRFLGAEALRDHSFVWAAIILVAATLLAAGNGIAGLEHRRQAIADAGAMADARLAETRAAGERILNGEKPKPPYWNDPTDARGFGYYLLITHSVKPPTPLSALTTGSSDVLPDVFRLSPDLTTGLAASYDIESPDRLALGRLDAGFVVIFLLPLLIAAVGHTALAVERDGGRLPLLAIHGITPLGIAGARLGLRLAVMISLMAAAILVPLATAGIPLNADVFAWLAVALAYGAVWAGVTLLVVSLAPSAATAAGTLGALWVGLVVILPWCISLGASLLYPAPSRVEQVLSGRAATDEASAMSAEALGRYLQDHPELTLDPDSVDAQNFLTRQLAATRLIEDRQAASDAIFDRQMEARQNVMDRLSWLSPPILAQSALVDLSGTGLERHRDFLAQTRAYVTQLRGYFEPRAMAGDKVFRDWDGWPRFVWREPPPGQGITAAATRAAGLTALAVVLCAFSAWRLTRRRNDMGRSS